MTQGINRPMFQVYGIDEMNHGHLLEIWGGKQSLYLSSNTKEKLLKNKNYKRVKAKKNWRSRFDLNHSCVV